MAQLLQSGHGAQRVSRAAGGTGFTGWIEAVAAAPWPCTAGAGPISHPRVHPAAERRSPPHTPLYTAEQRARRDASPWTIVQAVLAPLQFLVFAVSLIFVARTLLTGEGAGVATASVILKTGVLYAIMITGSIWEKEVFGKWLFAESFFWEDVFSMLVLALHTAYLVAALLGLGSTQAQMWLALAAYAAYLINAGQFLWKLRQARLEGGARARGGGPAQTAAA